MKKVVLDSSGYTFNAGASQIVFTNSIEDNRILLITNITDNIIIYNFACEDFGGKLSNKTLTLEYNTSSMSDDDTLQVVVYSDTDPADDTTHALLEQIRRQTEVQDEMLEQLELCAKYLRKIYNPE